VVGTDQTDRRFGVALRDLVLALNDERFLTPSGNVNWLEFVKAEMEPRGVKYETLRKAVAQERAPGATLIERVADAIGVKPEYFSEYRLAQALRSFDPAEVGYDKAMKNLRIWADAQEKKRKR
jgi:hypothetical protein